MTEKLNPWRNHRSLLLGIIACSVVIVLSRSYFSSSDGPEAVVVSLLEAVDARDKKAVVAMLSPRLQTKLATNAKETTYLTAGARRVEMMDLIAFPPQIRNSQGAQISVMTKEPTTASVAVAYSEASSSEFALVKIDGVWKIDLIKQ